MGPEPKIGLQMMGKGIEDYVERTSETIKDSS